jgi:hypothetical protein
MRAQDIEYDVKGTPPMSLARNSASTATSSGCIQKTALVDMGAEGYAGCPMGPHGNGIGLIGIISQHFSRTRRCWKPAFVGTSAQTRGNVLPGKTEI